MSQLFKQLTSAQDMVSQFMSWSPISGPALTAQSLEPASDSVSPLSALPQLTLCLYLFQKYINVNKKFLKKRRKRREEKTGKEKVLCNLFSDKGVLIPTCFDLC